MVDMKKQHPIPRKTQRLLLEGVPPGDFIFLRDFQKFISNVTGSDVEEAVQIYRLLRKTGAITSWKEGWGWAVGRTEYYDQVMAELKKKGPRIPKRPSTALLLPSLSSGHGDQIPRYLRDRYWADYHKGELTVAFVPADAEVVAYKLNGTTHRVEEYKA